MKAKRENKVYSINTVQEKQRYLKEGYDIYDDDGKILEYSPKKKILYSEYVKVMKENERLQLLAAEKQAENEALRAEIAALKPEKKSGAKKEEGKNAGE